MQATAGAGGGTGCDAVGHRGTLFAVGARVLRAHQGRLMAARLRSGTGRAVGLNGRQDHLMQLLEGDAQAAPFDDVLGEREGGT